MIVTCKELDHTIGKEEHSKYIGFPILNLHRSPVWEKGGHVLIRIVYEGRIRGF